MSNHKKPGMSTMNPFSDTQAEKWGTDKALERFVPPPGPARVWDEIRVPKNRVLWGGWGTGKSVILKRISWQAMSRAPQFNGDPFVGVYMNLADFDPLNAALIFRCGYEAFSGRVAAWAEAPHGELERYSNFAKYIIALHLAANTCEVVLANATNGVGARHLCERVKWIFPDVDMSTNMVDVLRDEATRVNLQIGRPEFSKTCTQLAKVPDLRSIAAALAEGICADLGQSCGKVGFLFDQFDQLEPPIQELFIPMLKRENPFFTVVATRPFGVSPDLISKYSIGQGNDFWITFVEYLPGEEDSFLELVEVAGNRLLECHKIEIEGGLRALLDTNIRKETSDGLPVGLERLARLAFPSVRRFFDICSYCWAERSAEKKGVTFFDACLQARSVKTEALAERDRISEVQRLPSQRLWNMLLLVGRELDKAAQNEGKAYGIGSPISLVLRPPNKVC